MKRAAIHLPGLPLLQRGFTLLEIMVVVVIVALLSAISVLALRQAGDRPYLAEAGRVQAWLQDLADRALLEGVAYGIQIDPAPGAGSRMQAMVYYRYRWYPLADPEALQLAAGTNLTLPLASNEALDGPRLPALVWSEGALLPEETLYLSFSRSDARFALQWQADSGVLDLLPQQRRP